jgi:hypothetical protein
VKFHIYNDAGVVRANIDAPNLEHAFLQCGPGEHIGTGPLDGERFWVVDDQPVARPAMTLHDTTMTLDGVERVLVSDIPAGTTLKVDRDELGTIDDGALEFTPVEAGRFQFRLVPPFPCQWLTFEVVVHEAGS